MYNYLVRQLIDKKIFQLTNNLEFSLDSEYTILHLIRMKILLFAVISLRLLMKLLPGNERRRKERKR